MGNISNSINHYLSDNRRFADLFNGICFQGETVVHAGELSDVSPVYYGIAEEGQSGKGGQTKKAIAGLKKLIEQDERYRHIDAETLETMSVMLEQPSIWKEREKYMGRNVEKEEYDMCQALREWAEEERSIGRQTGIREGRCAVVRNMLVRGMAYADIMAIAECDQEFIDNVRRNI